MKYIVFISLLLTACRSTSLEYAPIGVLSPLSNNEIIIITGSAFEVHIDSDIEVTYNGEKLTKNYESGSIIESYGYLILSYKDFRVEKRKLVKIGTQQYLMDSLAFKIWDATGLISDRHGNTLILQGSGQSKLTSIQREGAHLSTP